MSARLPIGARRWLLTLEAPIDTPDDNGGVARTYAPLATLRAQIIPMTDALIYRADQQQRLVTHDIRFRAWPGLTAAMRLTLGARVFQILSFEDYDDKGATTRALCEEVGP